MTDLRSRDARRRRRGKQRGLSRFNVTVYFENGLMWSYESIPGSNPTVEKIRDGLKSALVNLDSFSGK